MRVLAVATPALGHLFPAVPLLWALRARGDEVLVVTGGDALRVAEAGLPVVDALPGETLTTLFGAYQETDPAFFVALRRSPMTTLRDLAPVLAYLAGRLLEPARRAAERWRPDAILATHGQAAGAVVAAEHGIPLVEHGFGFVRSDGAQEAVRQLLAERLGPAGSEPPPERYFLDIAVPSMTSAIEGMSLRAVPYNGGAVLPLSGASVGGRPPRPRVLVTAGTQLLHTHGAGALAWLPEVAAGHEAEFLLAAGGADLRDLGRLPPHVRVLDWTPLATVLPTCSAVVHHGGSGTTLAALAAGVPQLVSPALADNHINARAVADRGAGLETAVPDATTLTALLREPAFAKAAREVADELRSLPAPADVAARLHTAFGLPTTQGDA
uniref:Elloramycin glycosyltransferase ElmGT n=1 Tax=Streptomyces olivaceus TaxID=47716 RepID=ELMGT_STROV|nr:RecName: Full=Elloramycin glycosyltransferase ElmGT [Streptomyces olivaceus]CAC16413.2 elloramycin glycosyltransferase [Streptomyces olivaceus]CAP12607.1 glycosyltransferase [Streptomyces olivaceus]